MQCLRCKETAHLPVVTQCGHIFCWKCVKNPLPGPCPECGTLISKETITSLYIDDDSNQGNNKNDFNENEDDKRPEQRSSTSVEQHKQSFFDHIIRVLRETRENEMNQNLQMSDEIRNQLFSIPKWFVVIIISLMVFFMVYVFVFS